MEIRELRSFSAAARLHSISKAARELGLGQPTVTTHIKKLEEELGMTLFDRVKRPIQLTLAGQRLSDLVTPLVEGIDSLPSMTALAEEEGPGAHSVHAGHYSAYAHSRGARIPQPLPARAPADTLGYARRGDSDGGERGC